LPQKVGATYIQLVQTCCQLNYFTVVGRIVKEKVPGKIPGLNRSSAQGQLNTVILDISAIDKDTGST